MHKSATKCNETLGKWCKNEHGASKIIDTLETYQSSSARWQRMGSTGAMRAPLSASSTTCMETHRPSLLMTHGAASSPRALARSSDRHRQAKAADRAAVLRAATPEAAAPSKVAEQAGHARSQCQRQGRSLRLAHRRCTSICGLTMSRRSPRDLLAQSERHLTKEARGMSVAVRGARRASTPSMLRLTSHANSTTPWAGKRPTPRVSANS
jgi:hypothetical protein